jgi:hypothetical protein
MADFVAVIRRAVDGLSDNNAEMRQKVYEKARGAVRRQLESMNPRPSDELVTRQLDKLEAAIDSVEGDHAEALPAEELAPEPVEDAAQPELVAEEPVAEPLEEPAQAETEQRDEPVAEPVEDAVTEPMEHREDVTPVEEPVAEEPVAETAVEPETASEPEPEPEPEAEAEAEVVAEAEPEAEPEAVVETVAEEVTVDEDVVSEEPQPVVLEARQEPSWQVEAEPADDYVPSWQDPEQERTPAVEPEAIELVEDYEPEPQQTYPVHDEQVPEAEPVADARMPAAGAQWDWNELAPASTSAENREQATLADPMAWEWPEEKAVEPAEARQEKPTQSNEWGDLDALIGQTPKAATTAAASSAVADSGFASATSSATAETARAPQRSFRAEPRKSRVNLGAIAAIIGLLAVVGGAGAGYWLNRDAVNGWVNELVASATGPSTDKPAETPQTTTDTDTAEGGRNLPVNTTPSDTAQTDKAATTEVASATPASGKFTQRLMTDGSEVDNGPAPALDGGAAEEGKSVAAQTAETAGVATDGGAAATATGGETTVAAGTDGAVQTPAGTDTATTTDTQTPATTGEQAAAIGVTQKMFLYEERLGQTSPTAIEGTVAWSEAEESPGGDSKPEPVVRAQVNVPSKGLTALITFRRNADKSLPASHIVELVFSLPENFEGGGIESVQRVAMKRTEQDRGDALIAVPAKITDDFHMIALNDFPEAIAKNTELLRTRSWVDIPITYRNGRRALLTLDKGTAGAEAFDKVMKAWATAGGTNSQ